MDETKELWRRCVAFHGHVCGGLTIGYKAALYAIELLDLNLSEGADTGCISPDEQVVCISENDACGVDAIQVILGCSIGKGNLLFHMRGKQAFTFYNRTNGKSARIILKPKPGNLSKGESLSYYQAHEPSELFEVKPVKIALPEPARIFRSYICSKCGEVTGSNWIRIIGDEMVCQDCYQEYNRFEV